MIALGSTSEVKVQAVMMACDRLKIDCVIIPYAASSLVNVQPVDEEILMGAGNRVLAVREKYPEAYCVGIENGLMQFGEIWMDVAIVVAKSPVGNERHALSEGVEVDEHIVAETKLRGFDRCTIGEVVAEWLSGNKHDQHHKLTHGKTDRVTILAAAVHEVLEPYFR